MSNSIFQTYTRRSERDTCLDIKMRKRLRLEDNHSQHRTHRVSSNDKVSEVLLIADVFNAVQQQIHIVLLESVWPSVSWQIYWQHIEVLYQLVDHSSVHFSEEVETVNEQQLWTVLNPFSEKYNWLVLKFNCFKGQLWQLEHSSGYFFKLWLYGKHWSEYITILIKE